MDNSGLHIIQDVFIFPCTLCYHLSWLIVSHFCNKIPNTKVKGEKVYLAHSFQKLQAIICWFQGRIGHGRRANFLGSGRQHKLKGRREQQGSFCPLGCMQPTALGWVQHSQPYFQPWTMNQSQIPDSVGSEMPTTPVITLLSTRETSSYSKKCSVQMFFQTMLCIRKCLVGKHLMQDIPIYKILYTGFPWPPRKQGLEKCKKSVCILEI